MDNEVGTLADTSAGMERSLAAGSSLVCMLGILARNVVLERMGLGMESMPGHMAEHKVVDKVVDSKDRI
jgi:hypothetical protein